LITVLQSSIRWRIKEVRPAAISNITGSGTQPGMRDVSLSINHKLSPDIEAKLTKL
jgi:hypothetical protein